MVLRVIVCVNENIKNNQMNSPWKHYNLNQIYIDQVIQFFCESIRLFFKVMTNLTLVNYIAWERSYIITSAFTIQTWGALATSPGDTSPLMSTFTVFYDHSIIRKFDLSRS